MSVLDGPRLEKRLIRLQGQPVWVTALDSDTLQLENGTEIPPEQASSFGAMSAYKNTLSPPHLSVAGDRIPQQTAAYARADLLYETDYGAESSQG